MCFNSNLSLSSFIFCIIGIIMLYYRNNTNDRYYALIFLFISFIQLGEFFAWVGIDNKNNLINIFGSYIIYISLYMQIIAAYLGIYFIANNVIIEKKKIFKYLIIITVLITISFINLLYKKSNDMIITKGYYNHLIWGNNTSDIIFYLFYITYPLIIFILLKNKFIPFIVGIYFYIGFLLSYMKYSVRNLSHEWRSIWCLIGSLAPYLVLLFNSTRINI